MTVVVLLFSKVEKYHCHVFRVLLWPASFPMVSFLCKVTSLLCDEHCLSIPVNLMIRWLPATRWRLVRQTRKRSLGQLFFGTTQHSSHESKNSCQRSSGITAYSIIPQQESLIYFLSVTHSRHTQQLEGPSWFRHTKHSSHQPPGSHLPPVLDPGLLQLVLPIGAAESWVMTTSAKGTERREGKEKNLFPQSQVSAKVSSPTHVQSHFGSTSWSTSSWKCNDTVTSASCLLVLEQHVQHTQPSTAWAI